MGGLTGRNAIAFAAIMYFLAPVQSTLAEAITYPGCSKLKAIGDELRRIKEQQASLGIADLAERCPLYREQIKYHDEMINIFESDSNRCGVRNQVLEQLKASAETLRVTSSAACDHAECSKIKMIGEELVRIKEQREAITKGDLHHEGDRDQLCPLFFEQIKYNDEMINIFEGDSNRCGAGTEAVDRLKTTTEKLRVSASKTCS
jgi:hypothetical protein